jgi:glycosyltransferase involved in cell wall biosynthesis
MSKIKVCILQNGFGHGGTDTFVINLCRGIDREKFDVSVVNPCNDPEKNILEDEISKLGIPVIHTAGFEFPINLLKHCWQLYKYLKKNKIDTFHTNIDLFNGPQLFVAWLAGVENRICHSHNGAQPRAVVFGLSPSIKIYQRIMRWLCKTFANKYTGCSVIAMDFLFPNGIWKQHNVPAIISNGIDLKKYTSSIDVALKRQELGLSAPKHIVTVGRFVSQKNPLYLSKVFFELSKIRSDVDLIWVGSGDLQSECRSYFTINKILNRVHFFEKRDDVADILKCCDVFLMPSLFEGLPIALIEAQAAHLQCLVSDTISSEVNCGLCQFMSINLAPEDWAKSLNKMLDTSDLLLNKDVLNEYSTENMVHQIQVVFTPHK